MPDSHTSDMTTYSARLAVSVANWLCLAAPVVWLAVEWLYVASGGADDFRDWRPWRLVHFVGKRPTNPGTRGPDRAGYLGATTLRRCVAGSRYCGLVASACSRAQALGERSKAASRERFKSGQLRR